jgi:hypothetical protein
MEPNSIVEPLPDNLDKISTECLQQVSAKSEGPEIFDILRPVMTKHAR